MEKGWTALSSHDSRDQSTKEEGRKPNPDGAGPSSDGQTQSPEHCTLCRSSGVASGDWGLRYGHRPRSSKEAIPMRSRAGPSARATAYAQFSRFFVKLA